MIKYHSQFFILKYFYLELSKKNYRILSNFVFLTFLKLCIGSLPATRYLKRIRADRGFFNQKNFDYCQDEGYEYLVKKRVKKPLPFWKSIITHLMRLPADWL